MTFFNIFSNKKVREDKKVKILIDNREKNSLVPSELARRNIEIEFQQLKVGDYIVNNIPVERKTVSDLKSSIINKRIFDQIKNLQKNKGILFIEGIADEEIYSGTIHENAFKGFLLSLATKNKVPFIFTKNPKDTALYLSILAKKKEPSSVPLRPSRTIDSRDEQIQFILEGFPNIGPITAEKLIKKFKTLRNLFNASKNELTQILGKRTDEFISLLD